MTGTPLQLSVAVTLAGLGAGIREAHWTVTPAGQVICGAVPSKTVMVCVQVAVLRHASVARYVRVIVYRFTQDWLVVTSPKKAIVTFPPQLSLVVTDVVLGAGTWLEHETVTGAGQVMLGGV
jgi:hypothetical protein